MNKHQKNLTTKTRKVLSLIDEQNKAQYKLDGTKKPQIELDFRQARKTVKILFGDYTTFDKRFHEVCWDMVPAMLKLNAKLYNTHQSPVVKYQCVLLGEWIGGEDDE